MLKQTHFNVPIDHLVDVIDRRGLYRIAPEIGY